jgi:hypothetical protein
MRRIFTSLGLVLAAGGVIATGATGAFFGDTESSVGNTFAAGAIDLTIDNTSYYNGVATSSTSWAATDLTIEKFFNFLDLKPGDFGEDTISLHVATNDAYLCANVSLTSNDDNGINEPESADDQTDGPGNGELADNVNFVWWADDGDNVLEDDEDVISSGPIGALTVGATTTVTLADSATNIWTGSGGPISGNQTFYIGKAWCFGTMAEAPLAQDDLGTTSPRTPANSTGGISCDGSTLDNSTQTDSLTADVSFEATQARNNPNFLCEGPEPGPEDATLTLVKSVNNSGIGGAVTGDWTLSATGPTPISGFSGSSTVTNVPVAPGNYALSESPAYPGYAQSVYSCTVDGNPIPASNNITLVAGQNVVCTVTNTAEACLAPNQKWADSVFSFSQGRQRNGAPINANRSDPSKATGVASSTGAATDTGIPVGTFVSLGFATTSGLAQLAVSFDNNVILNGPGNDVRVYEITNGTYPDEHAMVEASQDGSTWVTLTADSIRDITLNLDLGPLPWAKYVRITDKTSPSAFITTDPAIADGYDVDAVEALNCASTPVQP